MKRLSEAEFRNKITWMTFILSCLVVMIHSYNADLFINGEGTGVFAESVKQVQALVSLAVPSIAVPGFLSFHPICSSGMCHGAKFRIR